MKARQIMIKFWSKSTTSLKKQKWIYKSKLQKILNIQKINFKTSRISLIQISS